MRKRCTLPRKSESRTGMLLVLSECRHGLAVTETPHLTKAR